ncbi:MAG: exonuclease subunit SbcD [Epsilonproteobacteria bacterium]|nr:exonuclease subunit SbcD [Campylobacterota bacterium]
MKILHTSDIHFGHSVDGIDRNDEFHKFIEWFTSLALEKKPDCVVIGGDVFDVYFPSNEALENYYSLLLKLKDATKKVIIIGGNHDSFKTLKAPKEILKHLDVLVISGAEDDYKEIVEFDDFRIVAVSFLREAILKKYDEDITAAISKIYSHTFDDSKKNIALGHLSISGVSMGESERDIYIGGIEGVSVDVFKDYDLALLGHIHRPQKIKNAIYCGSPLPLSFGEEYQKKVVYVEDDNVEFIDVPKFREFKRLKGNFEEVLSQMDDKSFIEIELNEFVDNEKLKLLKKENVVKITLPYIKAQKKRLSSITPESIVKELIEDEEVYHEFLEIIKEINEA